MDVLGYGVGITSGAVTPGDAFFFQVFSIYMVESNGRGCYEFEPASGQ